MSRILVSACTTYLVVMTSEGPTITQMPAEIWGDHFVGPLNTTTSVVTPPSQSSGKIYALNLYVILRSIPRRNNIANGGPQVSDIGKDGCETH